MIKLLVGKSAKLIVMKTMHHFTTVLVINILVPF